MSLKSKAKAAKQRLHKQRLAEQEEQALVKEEQRLKTLKAGFTFASHKVSAKVKVHGVEVLRRNYLGTLPAKADPPMQAKIRIALTDEEQIREDRAQREIKAKQSLVMPLFNKGGMQYPTESDLKDFKQGLLRRRS